MEWRSSSEPSAGRMRWARIAKPIFQFAVCIAAVLALTAVFYAVPLQDRALTASLTFLIVVLIVSITFSGVHYAIFISLCAALGFAWLLPPVGRFWLSDPRDAVTLAVFLVIGITASHFSDRARREALKANQRRAEAVAAQERFRDLVNSVEGIVWEADAATFAFLFVSDQAERILGYPAETWLNEPAFWKDHLHPEDRDWAIGSREEATAKKRSHDFEYRMIAADGRVVWLRDLVTVVVENQGASRLRGLMIDITKRRQDEETSREQANLLTLTHDAILVLDTTAAIKYWNRAAEEMYGWTAAEASGNSCHRLLKTVFPVPLEQVEARLMGAGRWEGELVHTRKDGTLVVVASRWFLQQNKQGTPMAIMEINSDITEQKRAEQARQEMEEQWKAAFESNPTMYFIIDAAGEIVSVNAFGAEQLGYSISELVGQSVLNVFYEPDRDAIRKHASKCFEQPGRMMRWEARKVRKDGAMLWVRETGNAVVLKQRPVLLVVCENITEQKRAEDAARRSEKELREIIETMPAMAWSALPDGSNAFVNKNWAEYTGLSAEQTSGSGWTNTVHPEDLDRHVEKWSRSVATGQPFEHEFRLRRADGEYRWFLIRGVPLRDEQGSILKWYGTATDIEDRKRAEALLIGEKQILEMVAKGDSLAYILESLCRLVEEQAYGVLASVLLLDGNCLRHGGAPSLPKAYIDAIDGVVVGPAVGSCGTAAYRSEQVIVEDIAIDPLWADYREAALRHSLRACWSTPIFSSQGKVIATFAMYYRERRSPSTRDQEIIEQITHLAGVAIERRQTQEALSRSEAYLAEAQRLTRTGSLVWEPVRARTIHCSDEVFRMFGLDPQKGIPAIAELLQRVHPEDRERITGDSRRGDGDKVGRVVDYRVKLPDGTVRYIHSIRYPILNDAGELTEFLGTLIDVTEQKRAEEELRAAETRFRTYVDHATDALFVHDELGKIVDMNRQACESLGYTREELIGAVPSLFDLRMDEISIQRIKERLEAGDLVTFESANRRKDGTVFPVEVRVSTFFHGDHRFALSLARDISDRKRAEQERERLRQIEEDLARINRVSMMGELTASLGHEIKQPIAAAVSNAEACLQWLTRDQPDLAEVREAATEMVKEARRAAEITTRIRSLFRKEAMTRSVLDLNEVITDTVSLIREEADRRSIQLRIWLDAALPGISADRVQLQQVLMNLLLNGLEAMNDTGGELIVKLQQDDDGRPLISICDSGIGLPVGEKNRIFDAFFTTKPQGTGMGLAISRSIVESHGGRLWATPNSGQGTTFHFTLPNDAAGA